MPEAQPASTPPRALPGWAYTARAAWSMLNGSTLVGLLIALIGRASFRAGPRRLWFAEGYRFDFPIAGAFTVGNLVITKHTMAALEDWRPGTFDHEDAHAWQYAAMLGLPYLPAYWLLCAWSWLRTGDVASDNFFERNAGLARGGYVEHPVTYAGLKRIGRALAGGSKPADS